MSGIGDPIWFIKHHKIFTITPLLLVKVCCSHNIWLSCIIATYFVRHAVHLFLATHILAKYFVRHIFWDIFLVIYFVRHQHIGEPIFEFRTTRKETHTSPSSFLQAYCRMQRVCGSVCSAFKKSALSEPIQFLLRPKSTRQDSNKRGCVFPFPFPVWFWFCSYSLLIWENWRQDSSLATIYKQVRFCVSLSCLVLVLLMCSAHTSSIWQDSSHTYNNLDSIIIARLWLSCAF